MDLAIRFEPIAHVSDCIRVLKYNFIGMFSYCLLRATLPQGLWHCPELMLVFLLSFLHCWPENLAIMEYKTLPCMFSVCIEQCQPIYSPFLL